MIDDEVVLVLGAGASKSFGFPDGFELREKIIDKLNDTTFSHNIKVDLRRDNRVAVDQSVNGFKQDLQNANPKSIDQWLSHRNENERLLARAVIGNIIIEFENQDRLFDRKNNWYDYLYRILDSENSLGRFGDNKLTVVTFNYDRSIEHFLFTRLLSDYGNEKGVVAVLGQIPIIHVHGKIFPLYWQDGENKRPYNHRCTRKDTLSVGKNIDLIGETKKNVLNVIRDKMLSAKKIFFLGFGYHPENLSVLGLDVINNCNNLVGTAHGLISEEKKQVKKRINKIMLFDNTILEFFKEEFDLGLHNFDIKVL